MTKVWENKALSCFVKEPELTRYYGELELMYQPLQAHVDLSNEVVCFTKELLYKLATTPNLPGDTSTLEVQSQVHDIVSELNSKVRALGREYKQKLLTSVREIYQADSGAVPAPINFESVISSAIEPYLEKASRRREHISEAAWKNYMLTNTDYPVMQINQTEFPKIILTSSAYPAFPSDPTTNPKPQTQSQHPLNALTNKYTNP